MLSTGTLNNCQCPPCRRPSSLFLPSTTPSDSEWLTNPSLTQQYRSRQNNKQRSNPITSPADNSTWYEWHVTFDPNSSWQQQAMQNSSFSPHDWWPVSGMVNSRDHQWGQGCHHSLQKAYGTQAGIKYSLNKCQGSVRVDWGQVENYKYTASSTARQRIKLWARYSLHSTLLIRSSWGKSQKECYDIIAGSFDIQCSWQEGIPAAWIILSRSKEFPQECCDIIAASLDIQSCLQEGFPAVCMVLLYRSTEFPPENTMT